MVSRVTMPLFKRAQNGEAEAQLALGKIYLQGGQGLKRDAETAFYWLSKAASNGNPEAGRLIGRGDAEGGAGAAEARDGAAVAAKIPAHADVALADWLLTGQVATNDELNAADVLRRAAAKGERTAQLRLAMLLLAGDRTAAEIEEALLWLKRASRGGSRAAAVRLAEWYWARSDPAAGLWLDELAEVGEPQLLYCLGVMMAANGKAYGASSFFETAARREHVPAQLSYGLLHCSPLGRQVTGVPHSLKKAAFWLEKASQRGSAQASFELHRLFRLRQFSLKNSAVAERYLEIAARQGHAQAQFECGLACLRDTLSRKDIEAARWLLQAAKRGHRQARTICRLLYARTRTGGVVFAADPSRLVKLLARTRIALAARIEIGQALRLDIPELLLLDPQTSDHGDFLVVDIRAHLRAADRRIVAVETPQERAMLDRARRLLDARNPHPTDVRGPLAQRKLDLTQTLRLLGNDSEPAPGAGLGNRL